MRRIAGTLILYCILAVFLAGNARADKAVSLATLDWEPYLGEKLPGKGYVARLVDEAFKRSGYTVTLTFLPWSRAVQETLKGEFDACLPEYWSKEREEQFLFSAPVPGGPLVLFKRADFDFRFASLKDLEPYTVGVVIGYVNTSAFDAATFIRKEAAASDLLNLRKLAAGRVDLVVIDKFVAQHLIETEMPGQKGLLVPVDPPLEEKDLHLCFPKANPQSAELMKAFNEGLKTLKEDGGLKAILDNRGF